MVRLIGFAIGYAGIALFLLAATGCTISITPAWSRPVVTSTAADSPPTGMIPIGPQGPVPGGPNSKFPTPAANNEALSQLIKQFNDADDHRKALLEQVQTLKKQIQDRDDKLRYASHEMEESTTKIKKTRDEFRAWETEMNELRERVRKLEDNRRAVGHLIEEILGHLDRPREPLKLPTYDRLQK